MRVTTGILYKFYSFVHVGRAAYIGRDEHQPAKLPSPQLYRPWCRLLQNCQRQGMLSHYVYFYLSRDFFYFYFFNFFFLVKFLLAVLRIWDPGLGAFLTPGSGIRDGRKSASGSGVRDEQPGSYFLELRNHFFAFFGVKILKFFDEDPGSGIRDGDSSDPGSGMEKSRIRDPG